MSTPLTIHQHASFDRHLRLRQGGSPIDLTGYEVLGQIRAPDGTLAADFACVPTGEPGEVHVSLTPTQTGSLSSAGKRWPAYKYDFVLRRTSDDWRQRILYGPVTVVPGVTQ